MSVGCRVEEVDEILEEESIRQRLRRALLDHICPSASTNSVLKVDGEETFLLADPGFALSKSFGSSSVSIWEQANDNSVQGTKSSEPLKNIVLVDVLYASLTQVVHTHYSCRNLNIICQP